MNILQRLKSLFFGSPEKPTKERVNVEESLERPLSFLADQKDNVSRQRATGAPKHTQSSSIKKNTFGAVGISYDPELISQLQNDHQVLLRYFAQTNFAINDDQFDEGLKILQRFKALLLDHLHLENLKLYVYLQQSLTNMPEKAAQMRAFRKEIAEIGKVAIAFFEKYNDDAPITALNKNEFLAEFSAIGGVLSKRIQREEEELYAMYQQTQ